MWPTIYYKCSRWKRPIGYVLGNCVEGPLLECLDLFVVQGMRCTILIECIDEHRQSGS
jgi:hypothetical protein